MAYDDGENGHVAIRKTFLHFDCIKRLASSPWRVGGRYSYLYIGTRVYEEQDCIAALRLGFSEDLKERILREKLPEGQKLPSHLWEAVDILSSIYPPTQEDDLLMSKLAHNFKNAIAKNEKKRNALENECKFQEKVLAWAHLLKRVPPELRVLLGAWLRKERDQTLTRIAKLSCLPSSGRKYHFIQVREFHRQEKRWREGVIMNRHDMLFYYLWFLAGFGTVCYLELIAAFQGSVLTLFRVAPCSFLSLINILALLDYQFSDIRQIRSYLFTTGLGALMAALFGVVKLISPTYHEAHLTSRAAFVWKAILCSAWQTALHNWENLLGLYYYCAVTRHRLNDKDSADVTRLYGEIRLINACLFEWIDLWKVSIRCELQLSQYKRDHEAAARPLAWLARFKNAMSSSSQRYRKLTILGASIVLAIWVIGCTVPLDMLAGLLMISFAAPFCIRVAVDVWLPSQSFSDLTRLLIFTVGPTLPCNIGYLVNTVYWAVHGTPLFTGLDSRAFHIAITLNATATLYAGLWCLGDDKVMLRKGLITRFLPGLKSRRSQR